MHEDSLGFTSRRSERGRTSTEAARMKIVETLRVDENLDRSRASDLSFGYQSKAIVHENSMPAFTNPYEELTE
jgi:hypothetical protein